MSVKSGKNQVLAFLKEFHDAPDFDRLGAFFVSDTTYQPLVPTTAVFSGRKAIIAALRKQYLTYYDCTCEIHACVGDNRHVFTERTDHVALYKDDRQVASRVCAVFDCDDDDGQIVAWREYWDTLHIARQMDTEVDHVISAAG